MDLKNIPIGYFIVYKTENDWLQNNIVKAQVDQGFSPEDAQFVHVEPSIGNGYSIRASVPFVKPIDIFKEQAGRYIKIVRPIFLDTYDLITDFENEEGRFKTALWSASRSNLIYGLIGLLWFPLRKIIRMKNIFSFAGDFCSELCGYGLYKQYSPDSSKFNQFEEMVLPKHYNELMPADYLNPNYFETVHQGFIPEKGQ